MKRMILISIFITGCVISMFAQLKVFSNGDVKMKKSLSVDSEVSNVAISIKKITLGTTNTVYGVHATMESRHSIPTGDHIGLYGSAYNVAATNSPARYIGVVGYANPNYASSNNLFGLGVVGLASYHNSGAGIYGGIGQDLPTFLPAGYTYAGYFDGLVKVIGTLSATTLIQTSDKRLKKDVQKINGTDAIHKILQLTPISYHFKQIERIDSITNEDGIQSTVLSRKFDEKSQEFQKKHYGLIAQDLQTLYPDLVYEEDNGYLAINYTGLIPILIQSIKELNDRIEVLEKMEGAVGSQKAPQIQYSENSVGSGNASLYQNAPNPFSQITQIRYYLPNTVETAYLCVYDLQGKQLKQLAIAEHGEGTQTISASEFSAGIYLYALIADGKEVDVKRMILTE